MCAIRRVREVPEDPLAAAVGLRNTIAAAAADTERGGRVSAELLECLRNAGFFRMGLPVEVGGTATDLPTMMAVYEELARSDGSTGWVTMIGSGTNLILTALPPETVHELFSPDPDISSGGLLVPRGRATLVDGGYQVSGMWSFGSGCEHCDWLLGGCLLFDGDEPVVDDEGNRVTRMMVLPREDVVIHHTWDVSGLRGTGSHDYEAVDLFVPQNRSFRLVADTPRFAFPHARMPLIGTLAACLSAVLVGIARGAVDGVVTQSAGRQLAGKPLMDRPLLQERVARAEGLVQSARAFVFDAAVRAWDKAEAGESVSSRDELLMRLAASHAARACTEAVNLAFTAGGTAALYAQSPLQRFQRDMWAAQQHGMVAFYSFEALGRELLDVQTTV